MRYFFHYFLVIPTNFRHSFGHPQNETPHKHRTQPSRNALFFRSTAPPPAKCSAAPEAAANTKTACRTFPSADGLQLRQQESNLRWGSQSPLPYRLAMAHHEKQYSIFSAVSQEVCRVFAAFFPSFFAAVAAVRPGFRALQQSFCFFLFLPCFLRKASFSGSLFQKTLSA